MGGSGTAEGSPLRLLIDSNFFIALEPYAGDLEPGQRVAAEVVRLAAEQGHRIFVHPATREELLRTSDRQKRTQRLAELDKFVVLEEGKVPTALSDVLGSPLADSHDGRDLRILAALHQRGAAYLITDDRALGRRAARVGLRERVRTAEDALELLRQLAPAVPAPPPRVRTIAPHTIDAEQPIFESLRADYPHFDHWLDDKVRPDSDNRDCLVIEEDGRYAALAIVKRSEPNCSYGFPQPVTKIATLKVDTNYLGSKYGELLLKAIFQAAHVRRSASAYVEVLPRHEGLVDLLRRFGFDETGASTPRLGELVLRKLLRPPTGGPSLSPLDYHITYGPPAILSGSRAFIVPIVPEWHRQLFPDAPGEPPAYSQLGLFGPPATTHPWGNALRKAYLSNAATGQLRPGDTLLFYRSQGLSRVTAVGVVEDVLRSHDPVEVMALVGQRTVYTPAEIERMCRSVRGTLAILFRQDRFLEPPWTLEELRQNRVVRGWPQSIVSVPAEGVAWVHQQLDASS